jgi:hypothetical protein
MQDSQKPVLSDFLEYMRASGTATSNISINSQCSPCECSVTSTPITLVDGALPPMGDLISSMDGTVPPKDDWKSTFGRDDRDLALDDQDCDALFLGSSKKLIVQSIPWLPGYQFRRVGVYKNLGWMVRAMIHGRQVVSTPQVTNIVDR